MESTMLLLIALTMAYGFQLWLKRDKKAAKRLKAMEERFAKPVSVEPLRQCEGRYDELVGKSLDDRIGELRGRALRQCFRNSLQDYKPMPHPNDSIIAGIRAGQGIGHCINCGSDTIGNASHCESCKGAIGEWHLCARNGCKKGYNNARIYGHWAPGVEWLWVCSEHISKIGSARYGSPDWTFESTKSNDDKFNEYRNSAVAKIMDDVGQTCAIEGCGLPGNSIGRITPRGWRPISLCDGHTNATLAPDFDWSHCRVRLGEPPFYKGEPYSDSVANEQPMRIRRVCNVAGCREDGKMVIIACTLGDHNAIHINICDPHRADLFANGDIFAVKAQEAKTPLGAGA